MDSLLNMHGLAKYLDVSYDWVRARVKARQIPFTNLGSTDRMVRFAQHHIDAIIAAGEHPVETAPSPMAVIGHTGRAA